MPGLWYTKDITGKAGEYLNISNRMRRLLMRKIKLFSVLALVIATTLLMTSVVYAYAAYHGNWPEQPYWGNWWWYNYSDL